LVPQSTEESPITNNAGTRGEEEEEEGAVEGLRLSCCRKGGSWNEDTVLDSTKVEYSIRVDTKKYTIEFIFIIFLFPSSTSHAEIDVEVFNLSVTNVRFFWRVTIIYAILKCPIYPF